MQTLSAHLITVIISHSALGPAVCMQVMGPACALISTPAKGAAALPGFWIVAQDVEEGVHAGLELTSSEYVREMGDAAFPSGTPNKKGKNGLKV